MVTRYEPIVSENSEALEKQLLVRCRPSSTVLLLMVLTRSNSQSQLPQTMHWVSIFYLQKQYIETLGVLAKPLILRLRQSQLSIKM
jgi:hypothetical protein